MSHKALGEIKQVQTLTVNATLTGCAHYHGWKNCFDKEWHKNGSTYHPPSHTAVLTIWCLMRTRKPWMP